MRGCTFSTTETPSCWSLSELGQMWANQGRRPGQLPPSGQPLPSLESLPLISYPPFNPARCGQTRARGQGNCLLQVSLCPPLTLFLFLPIIPLTLPDVGGPGRRPGQLPPSGQPLTSLKAIYLSFYYSFNHIICGQTRGGGRGNCLLQVSLCPPLKLYHFLPIIPLTLPDVGKPGEEAGATASFRSASVLP